MDPKDVGSGLGRPANERRGEVIEFPSHTSGLDTSFNDRIGNVAGKLIVLGERIKRQVSAGGGDLQALLDRHSELQPFLDANNRLIGDLRSVGVNPVLSGLVRSGELFSRDVLDDPEKGVAKLVTQCEKARARVEDDLKAFGALVKERPGLSLAVDIKPLADAKDTLDRLVTGFTKLAEFEANR